MSTFSTHITKVLEEYKEILRSFLPLKEANARIYRLKLVNKEMLRANDLTLYKIANNAVSDLQTFIQKFDNNSSWYFKLSDYHVRLQEKLGAFSLENGKVIHPQQEASRLALEAIQILNLPTEKINSSLLGRLGNCMEQINKYGSSEQCQKLHSLIEKKSKDHSTINLPIISSTQFNIINKINNISNYASIDSE